MAVARATDRVSLAPARHAWWSVVAALWTVAELVAVTGAGWLAALGVIAWLQLPALPVPDAVGRVPWPTALLLGGGAAWLLIAALRSQLVRAGAARHRRRTLRALQAGVAEVAEHSAVDRVRAELQAHDALASALTRAAD